MRRRMAVTAIGLAALLVAGCGGDDGGDAISAASDTGDAAGAEESTGPADTGDTGTGDATSEGASSGDFCSAMGAFLGEYQETLSAAAAGGGAGSLDELSRLGQGARDAAPPELAGSVNTVTESLEQMVSALSSGEMDPGVVPDPDALGAAVGDIVDHGMTNDCSYDVQDYMEQTPFG